ncbi:IS3 family transposase [Plantactinospora sp. S1510]|uniref:IS3 family transposase n=1 Tax=Plantactinospora alkalitolerans TaxID=2789879 RepID=A0ABS0GSI0_9ACTN|nr:IS3 family transposase [Plantactinospora alkalitolerans]MBF9129156.1 IS3 family transposase [Plantactinospora alkalitolerans]
MTLVNELRDRFGVEPVLRVLTIAPSTYYGWVAREADPGPREVEDRGLLSEIVDIHDRSGRTYGSPRVHASLARRGIRVGRKRVERLMRGHDLTGAFLRRGWRGGSTKQNPRADPAPDLVNRNFTADAPNRLWVADATRIVTGEGVLWLAAVRDAFSNRIVGWKTSDRCNTDLVLGALEYGIWSRDDRVAEPAPGRGLSGDLPRCGGAPRGAVEPSGGGRPSPRGRRSGCVKLGAA